MSIISPQNDKIKGVLTSNQQKIKTKMDTPRVPTADYDKLINKPSIEGVVLEGDKTFEELNLRPVSNAELAALLD